MTGRKRSAGGSPARIRSAAGSPASPAIRATSVFPGLAALLLLFPLSLALPFSASAEPVACSLRPIVRVGEKAAPFTLSVLDGGKSSYRPDSGRPSLLVFWSAFCPLCRELALPLDGLSRRSGGVVRVVWVNLDGSRFTNAVRSFAKEVPVTGPVLLDEIRDDYFVACDPYGIEKTPTAVVVRSDGRIQRVYVAEEIRALLRDFEKEVASLRRTGGAALSDVKESPQKRRKSR